MPAASPTSPPAPTDPWQRAPPRSLFGGIGGELVALVLTIDAGALFWLLWLVGGRFGWW